LIAADKVVRCAVQERQQEQAKQHEDELTQLRAQLKQQLEQAKAEDEEELEVVAAEPSLGC
jgi:hypothetical protein